MMERWPGMSELAMRLHFSDAMQFSREIGEAVRDPHIMPPGQRRMIEYKLAIGALAVAAGFAAASPVAAVAGSVDLVEAVYDIHRKVGSYHHRHHRP